MRACVRAIISISSLPLSLSLLPFLFSKCTVLPGLMVSVPPADVRSSNAPRSFLPCNIKGATSIWNKTLADGSVAVGLLNTGNFGNVGTAFGDFNVSFTADAVGLNCNHFEATNVFTKKTLGRYSGGFWAEVDESSILLLKLKCSTVPSSSVNSRFGTATINATTDELPNGNGNATSTTAAADSCESKLGLQTKEIEMLKNQVRELKGLLNKLALEL